MNKTPSGAQNPGERWRQKVREGEAENPYRTHTSLLLSTHSPSSPISCRPPSARVCVRTPGKVGEARRAFRRPDYSSPATMGRACPPSAGPDAPVRVLSASEESGGISGPDPQTNGMQGHRISFCEHCGVELKPQNTRRGYPKRYCSDACRAKAWRRRAARRQHDDSIDRPEDAFLDIAGKHHPGNKTPDSMTTGEEVSAS